MHSSNYKHQFTISFSTNSIANYAHWVMNYWFEWAMAFLLIHLLLVKDVKISFQFKNKSANLIQQEVLPKAQSVKLFEGWEKSKPLDIKKVPKAQNFYNLTFILNPNFAKKKGIATDVVKQKEAILQNYIQTYVKTAKEEQAIYQIPASITLAQGLLESNAGNSRLSEESNNHFGIKCRAKCRGCTCRNYHDDDLYDMFRVFDNVWESYREHSILLSSKRYKHLKKYGNDYKKWAYGLKKAGYATDKKYAEKLIRIIEGLELYQYD